MRIPAPMNSDLPRSNLLIYLQNIVILRIKLARKESSVTNREKNCAWFKLDYLKRKGVFCLLPLFDTVAFQ